MRNSDASFPSSSIVGVTRNACARHPVLPASTKTTYSGARSHVVDRPSCVISANTVVASAHSAKNTLGRRVHGTFTRAVAARDDDGAFPFDAADERLR